MKISVVTETFPPEVNGVARTVDVLVRGMVDRGHDVQLIRPRQPDDAAGATPIPWREMLRRGLPIPFYPGLRFGLPSIRTLRRAWRARRPDLVHVVTEGPLGLSALRAARQLEISVTSSFHTNFHQYGKHYGYGVTLAMRYLRWFHNRTRLTLVPSSDIRDQLAAEGFERLHLLARGVDSTLFDAKKRSSSLRREWGVDDSARVAIYVGRVAPEKNVPLLELSFAELRRRGWHTVVVGDGPSAAGMRRRDGARAITFAGLRRGDDLAAHYASADVMIFPSLSETFGNVVLEAMASGLPVLGYDYAAARALVTPHHSGWRVPFGDQPAYLDAVQHVSSLDSSQLRHMGGLARLRALEASWGSILDRFEALLEDARKSRDPHAA